MKNSKLTFHFGKLNGLWLAQCGNIEVLNTCPVLAMLDLVNIVFKREGIESGIPVSLGDLHKHSVIDFRKKLDEFAEKSSTKGIVRSGVVVEFPKNKLTNKVKFQ